MRITNTFRVVLPGCVACAACILVAGCGGGAKSASTSANTVAPPRSVQTPKAVTRATSSPARTPARTTTAAASPATTTLIGTFGPPVTRDGGHVVDVTVRDAQHPSGDTTATGSVTVRISGPTTQTLGSGPVRSGGAHITLIPGDPGTGSVAAYYSGDGRHKPSSVCLLHGAGQCP
jgi:hypothetical protein